MRVVLILKSCKHSTGKKLKHMMLQKKLTGLLIKLGRFSFLIGKNETLIKE